MGGRPTSITMSKPDINYLSFSQDKQGRIHQWKHGDPGSTVIYDQSTPRYDRVVTLPADYFDGVNHREISDMLKFSGVTGLTVICEGVVPGGREDVADFNNECEDVVLQIMAGVRPHGQYGFTVKGGCQEISIITKFLNLARKCELDCGNWSDQSNRTTDEVFCEAYAPAGLKMRYRRLNSTTPELDGGPWKKLWALPSFLIKPVFAIWGLFK